MNPVDFSLVDRAVLATMHRHRFTDDAPHAHTPLVLALVRDEFGIAEVHTWESLLTMGRPWELQHPLVDFRGNRGSPSEPPADATYTKVRLTPLGRFSADVAGHGEISPTALVMGDVCRSGMRPPLRSAKLVGALRAIIGGRRALDDVSRDLVEELRFATGASIRCDTDQLLSGSTVTADITARIDVSESGVISLAGFAPGVGAAEVEDVVRGVLARDELRSEIMGVSDESTAEGERVLVRIRRPDYVPRLVELLAQQWPIRIRMKLGLGSPLSEILRAWVDQFPTTGDAHAHLDGLERSIRLTG